MVFHLVKRPLHQHLLWFKSQVYIHYGTKLNEYKLATRTRENVGFIVFSLSVKPISYGSTSIEKIMENFSKVKVEDFQHDYT
ncbi:hypothetical protein H5410_030325 [Solanum commersonii]|uniref:Uncharacterized protein n=1 Tax=Solanum commersonii TaxID=4109 RepID=A0A9J5YE06_SOLCO|nr:hypothetical protein H5410_030325 [Solanum commersonii]